MSELIANEGEARYLLRLRICVAFSVRLVIFSGVTTSTATVPLALVTYLTISRTPLHLYIPVYLPCNA
ncbi:hypothetical protein [Lunatimonas salinarum]|uniref:hypothetical protein n=1 Tax=Lunatimonas salinarum TaxID=1774590 RepID=UPI003CC920D7